MLYKKKDSDFRIQATKYKKGLEDGFFDKDIPYIITTINNELLRIPVNKNMYIIKFHENNRIITTVLTKKIFKKNFVKCKKGTILNSKE